MDGQRKIKWMDKYVFGILMIVNKNYKIFLSHKNVYVNLDIALHAKVKRRKNNNENMHGYSSYHVF